MADIKIMDLTKKNTNLDSSTDYVLVANNNDTYITPMNIFKQALSESSNIPVETLNITLLGTKTISQTEELTNNFFNLDVTYSQLKLYKRFAIIYKMSENYGVANTYISLGKYNLARFGDGGCYIELNKIGNDLYEIYGVSGNPNHIQTTIDANGIYYIGQLTRVQHLSDLSNISDSDIIKISYPTNITQIKANGTGNLTVSIYGITI